MYSQIGAHRSFSSVPKLALGQMVSPEGFSGLTIQKPRVGFSIAARVKPRPDYRKPSPVISRSKLIGSV